MDKAKIAATQMRVTGAGVGMGFIMRKEGFRTSDQIRTIECARWCPKYVDTLQQPHSASVPPGQDAHVHRKALPPDEFVALLIGSDDPNRGILSGQSYHLTYGFREQVVIGANEFGVFAPARNLAQRDVMVLYGTDKDFVSNYPDPAVLPRIPFSQFKTSICTAVVDNNVFRKWVVLVENAFDALGKKRLPIVQWRHDACERFAGHWFIKVSCPRKSRIRVQVSC